MKKQVTNNQEQVEQLQKKVEELEFDLLWQKQLAEKKSANTVITVNHTAQTNKFHFNKVIDTANDDFKTIIRKALYRNFDFNQTFEVLKSAYQKQADKSKSQKQLKNEDINQYVTIRVFKIANDILKEQYFVEKLGKVTAKQYFTK